jgi:DNA polymerase III epsilon subunit family exonuclease
MEYQDIRDVTFAVIDTETTGIFPRSSRVCEIAGVVSHGYEEIDSFSWLVNPEMPMPLTAFNVHGISDEMLADQPVFEDIAAQFLSRIENTVIVGHNINFDINFLNMELRRIGLRFPKLPYIDTLALARKSGLFSRNNLGTIAEELHINNTGWHRAMNDVRTTRQVLYFFFRKMEKEKGICKFKEIHKLSGGKYVK